MRPDLIVKTGCQTRRSFRFAVLWLCAFLMTGCVGGSDPEQEIRQWLDAAEAEAEERQRRAIMARISENYADARGNQKSDIENVLRYYFLRQKSVSLLTTVDELRVFGDSAAELDLTVAMAGSKGGLNLSADVWNFELELERMDGDWQLIGARWGQLGDELR